MFRKIRPSATNSPIHQQKTSRTVSLFWMLTVPFILQVVTVVGLVGCLSQRNAQRSVEDLTNQVMEGVGKRVEEKLSSYLATPRLANQQIRDAVQRGDLKLNLERSEARREQYLWQQMQSFSNLTWITLGSDRGDSLGVWRPGENQPLQISLSNRSTQYFGNYFATSAPGKRTKRLKVEKPAYDPRTRPWYKEAIAAPQGTWNSIYAGFTPGTIFIAASQPIYDPAGRLLGVVGTDISLLNIQTFLAQNPVSASGQVFLIERSGLLVASSSREYPFQLIAGRKPQRLNMRESQTPLIQTTAKFLQQQVSDLALLQERQRFSFEHDRQSHFVQVVPFAQDRGLDWLIVIVVPESDVMAQIQVGTQTTLGLCAIALFAVILLNALIAQVLLKPLRKLSQASAEIAQGDFSSQVEAPRILELSTLANAFNQMSQQLHQSREQLEEYSRSLAQKVNARTAALSREIQQRSAAEAALQSANQELQRLAYVDGLTQIANRRRFDEQLWHEWFRSQREQLPLSLVLCDVDYFKQYNDTYGHQVGDECLRSVAKALASVIKRPADLAARYGGEEFAVLLPQTDIAGAVRVAQMVQSRIKQLQLPHARSQVKPYVTVSFGVASLIPSAQSTPEQLLALADQALYQAKMDGRDRISMG